MKRLEESAESLGELPDEMGDCAIAWNTGANKDAFARTFGVSATSSTTFDRNTSKKAFEKFEKSPADAETGERMPIINEKMKIPLKKAKSFF